MEQDTLLRIGTAARILGLSTERVRQLAQEGRLREMRTVDGCRLFSEEDVERLAAEREEQRRQRQKEEQTT